MVSFQRMKDDLDDLGTHVSNKLPAIGRSGCLALVAVSVCVLLIIGFAIGYTTRTAGGRIAAQRRLNGGRGPLASAFTGDGDTLSAPNYVFVSNNSLSCPPLQADRLITTMERGQSFEGLVVNLQCRGDYNPFPNQIKCRRKTSFNDKNVLEWSHIPVCYPSVLVSKAYWSKVLHARSVSCNGDATQTNCQLTCIRDYVGVENKPYTCNEPPCPAWALGDSQCYMCGERCEDMHSIANPRADALLSTLGCQTGCNKVIVNSNAAAAVWQNKRTGLFVFMGEHNGRPIYQNNATKEFLFYTTSGSEWLVGPDFRKSHAGIQLYGNNDTTCPEKNGGPNVVRKYIDSSEPSMEGAGQWKEDETLDFQCMEPSYEPVECPCNNYKVYNLHYGDGVAVPAAVQHLTGNFTKLDSRRYGLLAPLYFDAHKNLYLFSHHPKGRVWQVSTKLSTTPMRGIFEEDNSCPDSNEIAWEWFNTTTPQGQQLYVKDPKVRIKCLDGHYGG